MSVQVNTTLSLSVDFCFIGLILADGSQTHNANQLVVLQCRRHKMFIDHDATVETVAPIYGRQKY